MISSREYIRHRCRAIQVFSGGRASLVSGYLIFILAILVLAGCASPGVAKPDGTSPTPTPTATTAAPTAATGATTGAPCESGTLRIKDLPAISERWLNGVNTSGERALAWKDDSIFVELAVSCELFESGFRWQSTWFSLDADAFFRADTAEVIPANAKADTIKLLPKGDVDFERLMAVLLADPTLHLQTTYVITKLEVRVSTPEHRLGPDDVPTDRLIYHVTVQTPGQNLELYVDLEDEKVYRYEQ
jgi:hypothetical protein